MGALYLAVTGDRGLERLLVIKTILPHLADAEYIARFRDEAKVVIKLSHGNLIPVFDAGQVNRELFLAMDFVEGRDLRAVWNRCAKKQVAFPIDVAVYLVKELCRGLAYAHTFPDLELVHRDVSPPNVLVSYTGEVKLTDFGLASSTLKLEKTAPGIIYGKVAYMSPEQARGERLDGRSDMYAAGIVLWELLTGRQLFPPGKDQPADLVTRAKNPEIMRPSKRAPRVPVELDEICVRALHPERAERYGTCDEMRQALQAWLAQNAPTMDAGRISSFLQDLFGEDVSRERAEREEMLNRLSRRAMTLPPTHELRQIVERSTGVSLHDLEPAEVPVRTPGSVGRRATDVGRAGHDRRQNPNRRYSEMSELPSHGSAALARAQDEYNSEIDLTGMVVDGRYRVDELIGEGGMGKVYLAEHIEIGKRVAIKVLHPTYSRMPELVERFRREARAASKIGHPNIVDVTDSGTTTDGSVYFVMEYLEGVELGAVIERDRSIDVARALRIATQICRALSAAHAVGIIHRDLKPENIFLVTRDNTSDFVKVLDFGIAKTAEAEAQKQQRLTSPGMAMGTPEYMAPEQAAGNPADARCDVYSLAAILYEMLTGEPPYRGDNFMEILTKKATVDPVPPHELRPDLPETVSRLVLGAMSRNPINRPASMDAFEYELNKCLSGRGAAVAQALGMSDPNLVAPMHPSLSGRTLEDGARARHSGPITMLTPPPSTLMAVTMAAEARSTGQHSSLPTAVAMARSTWEPELSGGQRRYDQGVEDASLRMVAPARTGSGVFGWVLLLLLLGGAVAVGYVFVRDPLARTPEAAPVAVPPPDAPPDPAAAKGVAEPVEPETAEGRPTRPGSSPGSSPSSSRRNGKSGASAEKLDDAIDKANEQLFRRRWSDAEKAYTQVLKFSESLERKSPGQLNLFKVRLARAQVEQGKLGQAQDSFDSIEKSGIPGGEDRGEYLLVRGDLARRKDPMRARRDYLSSLQFKRVSADARSRIRKLNLAEDKDADADIPSQYLK